MTDYTKEDLIGRIYIHESDVSNYPLKRKQIHSFNNDMGSTKNLFDDRDSIDDHWFTLKNANYWINDGTWILEPKNEIINNYSIY